MAIPPTAGTYGAGEKDCYTFFGDAGDQIRVNATVTSGTFNPDLEIIRPDGSSLCSTIFAELPCALDATGTHTVIVDGLGTGGYNITLTCLSGVCREVPLRNRFTDDTPTLRWSRLSWAIGYRIQVDDSANFAAPLVFTTTTPSNVLSVTTTPLDDGRYYWRVQGQRDSNSWGAWSQVDSFTVDAD